MLKATLLIVAIVGLAFVLNPSADSHREEFRTAIADRHQLAGLIGLNKLAAMATTYHTLGVASYSTLNEKVVTVGAFGIVFVPDLSSR